MTILPLPLQPGFAQSTFGLDSNTQVFRSPLSGQTQTLERPGARWRAEYTLPPMKRAQMAQWQSFLARLRGGAGRFYGFDPDARTPRGAALANTTSGRNEIRNSEALGVAGALPTNWSFGPSNGVSREVVSTGTEAGINYVEVRYYGTPTVNFTSLNCETNSQISAAEGETWSGALSVRLSGGSLTNVNAVQLYIAQIQASGYTIFNGFTTLATVDSTWRRVSGNRTISDTNPDTVRVRCGLFLSLIVGQPIDITLRVGQPQLERGTTSSPYIPTVGTARARDSGPRVDGASPSSGTTLTTWNWQPNCAGVLRAGDYIAFETAAGRELHMLTADADSDAQGRALLTFEPPLRNKPADNAAVIVQNASCVMALVDDSVSWRSNAQGVYQLSFAAEERF